MKTETLKIPANEYYNPVSYPWGFSMAGSIRCAKRGCGRPRNSLICPQCGHPTVYISLYWKGKHYNYWRDKDGNPLVDYRKAISILSAIRLEINDNKFNPVDWTSSKLKERKFENKVLEWLTLKTEEAEANELSFETIKNYKGYTHNFYIPFFNGWDAREIRFEQLEGFKDSLRGNIKIKTRRNILNGLHAFFAWLKRKGTITEIPAWPQIEGDDSEVRTAIDYDVQVEGLNKIPDGHRDVIEFGFETGLRPGETCALKLKDIDVKGQSALIQRTWSGSRLRETTKGKNKKPIPLSDRAFEIALNHIKSRYSELSLQEILLRHRDEFLFINPDTGKCYRVKKLNQLWKFSGMEITHYEASRHSFVTQLVENGADIVQVKELARHTNINTTLKYTHLSTRKLRDVVNARSGKVVAIAKRVQNEK